MPTAWRPGDVSSFLILRRQFVPLFCCNIVLNQNLL